MKIHHHIFSAIACTALFFHACTPAYIPNVVNTPLLSNKGEVQGAVYTGTSGFDPQFAYAVTDHFGVMLNGSFANRSNDTTLNFHKHRFVEAAGGYYTKIGEAGRFEAFGGAGIGKLNAYFENELWTSRADVRTTRLFIQPAIGAATDIFDGSFATRMVLVNLNQASSNTTDREVFLEPVLTGRVGYKYVKGVLQVGFSVPLTAQNDLSFDYQPLLISLGLQATLGKHSDQ